MAQRIRRAIGKSLRQDKRFAKRSTKVIGKNVKYAGKKTLKYIKGK